MIDKTTNELFMARASTYAETIETISIEFTSFPPTLIINKLF